jgi:ATP-dependent protease ClpP protease subunit
VAGSSDVDPKVGRDPLLPRVLADVSQADADAGRRRQRAILNQDELFGALEDGDPPRRLICYVADPVGAIDATDAAPLGGMLDSIGECDNLDLMLNSPGGFGEAAEKLVEMCRSRCRNEFRVIVPNYAKSAGTIIALGADVIVAARDRSELGPIDPQYRIVIAGQVQQVSGHTFVQAYNELHEQIAAADASGAPTIGLLTSLSATTMEPAFIEHCQRGVDFARDVATKFLERYQLPAKARAAGSEVNPQQIAGEALDAAENLLSEVERFSHGRLIGPEEARDDVGLHVDVKDSDDPGWAPYWELYVRAEVCMQTLMPDRRANKLFIDRQSVLPVFY